MFTSYEILVSHESGYSVHMLIATLSIELAWQEARKTLIALGIEETCVIVKIIPVKVTDL